MTFQLYDTRVRGLVEIIPAAPGRLSLYACGPTVYRYAHVGNLRTFLLGDLIHRNATRHGLRVSMVQNITDVGHLQDDTEMDADGEDKVLAQARAEGKSALDIARFYEAAFHRDVAALNLRPADDYPRATECIPLMLELIETLIERGHAYVGGDKTVYFDARSFDGYGAISGNRLQDLRPGHRMTAVQTAGAAEAKRFHADWALWKHAGVARQMVWDSPWGLGFPGWHIECSAMSLDRLGETIDVHTGGIDLRFPHHDDERAQSDAAVGHDVVRHWVHGEHLLFEGRKMAKSTGNVVLLDDVIAKGLDPLAMRLAFLSHRYRQQMNLTWETLEAADATLTRWRTKVAGWAESPSKPMCAEVVQNVYDAFDDDLDTSVALRVLRGLEKDTELHDGSKFETFVHLDALFGLDLARDVGKLPEPVDLPEGTDALLAARQAARAAKDWAGSDRLREQLAAAGVEVTDGPEGQQASLRVGGPPTGATS